ncbi:MAG TPA: hypothetical protein DCY93_03595 [Firmicutes bacterium]|nr:hypothetical protein [Bacillota bacterium]
MDVARLVLFILSAVGIITAMVLRWGAGKKKYATYVEVVSLIILVVGVLLFIVNGIQGAGGWANLFLFISVLGLTVIRMISLLRHKL